MNKSDGYSVTTNHTGGHSLYSKKPEDAIWAKEWIKC